MQSNGIPQLQLSILFNTNSDRLVLLLFLIVGVFVTGAFYVYGECVIVSCQSEQP